MLLLLCTPAAAQPVDLDELPPELRPWVPWVLDGLGDEICPSVAEVAVCTWPGLLELDLSDTEGSFRLEVVTDQRVLVPLPGSGKLWPQRVEADDTELAVLQAEDRPTVKLAAGRHEIRGRFFWNDLPEVLPIPKGVGRVVLTIRGERVAHPKRTDSGDLWLRAGAGPSDEPERLELEVFRRIADGVPVLVHTRLALRVAGRGREVNLGQVHLAGSTPLRLDSELAARLEPTGELLVQVFPGRHDVELVARHDGPLEELALGRKAEPWPELEIWTWAPSESVRQVEVSGAPGIDPSRTNLPEHWQSLQAFAVSAPGKLTFKTTRRGEPEPPPNQLTLRRQLWLDLDGEGYTVRDTLSGQLHRDWRLDLLQGALGRVVSGGQDQLITVEPKQGTGGVELRQGAPDLMAEWRLEQGRSHVPAVGWSEDAEQLSAELHLPPGWRLLGASGVDELPGTWLSTWDLFEVLVVLLISLATARLGKPRWGLVALAALVLSHGVPGAPRYVWVALLALMGLLQVLPAGRLRSTAQIGWWAAAATALLLVVSFGAGQLRQAFFPQTATRSAPTSFGAVSSQYVDHMYREDTGVRAKGEEESRANLPMDGKWRAKAAALRSSATPSAQSAEFGMIGLTSKGQQQDPKAIIQTGPGVPTWQWRSYGLSWTGPVARDHGVRLFLLSPWQSGALSLLGAALMGLLAYLLLRARPTESKGRAEPRGKSARPAKPAAKTAAVALLAAVVVGWPSSAEADAPRDSMLRQLKERLTRTADCGNDCVSASQMTIRVSDESLRIEVEVHAGSVAGYSLPGPAEIWLPREVTVDGEPSSALALLDDGFLHLRVEPGRHRVALSGPVRGDALTLSLGETPHRVRVEAPGWQVDGVSEDGQVEGSIQLTRRAEGRPGAAEPAAGATLPPWLRVTRVFRLGVTWTITTTVDRTSPEGVPIVLRLPLLPGEEVTEDNLLVEQGEVVATFGRTDEQLVWSSSLEPTDHLELRAQQGKPWTEVWIVESGLIWHFEASGLAPAQHQQDGTWRPMFLPWPGETLKLSLTRPAPAEGQSVTIDEVRYTLAPASRSQRARLDLVIRNSSGGTHKLGVPSDATIQRLTVDGADRPLQRSGDELSIALSPGSRNVSVQWQQPGGLSARYQAPAVTLGGPAVNAWVTVELPDDRWILWTSGPSWGPAVLFWGYLLLVLLAAAVLARLPHSPLRAWQWALLGVGLTQVPMVFAVVVVAWFFLLSFRKRWRLQGALAHNFAQLSIALCTILFLWCLMAAAHAGLVLPPDVGLAGLGSSSDHLMWYLDRSSDALPRPSVLSAPLWLWRVLMLAWSLWLAYSLLGWLRGAWKTVSADGLWRKLPPRPPKPTPATAAPAEGGSD